MTSSMTQALFKDYIKIGERFTSGSLMRKFGIDRQVAVNLISTLLSSHMIQTTPLAFSEKERWYSRIK